MAENEISLLIIDDESILTKSLAAILQSKGFAVKSTPFGRQGLEWLEEGFDVVLLDLKLPDIDGIELLRHIKKKFPETVVIVMTGFASVDDFSSIIKEGAYSYISKPFEIDELQDVISRGLSQKTEEVQKNTLLNEFSLLYKISKEMEGMIELHAIANLASRYLIKIIPLDVCAVLLFDKEKKEFFFGSINGTERGINHLLYKRFKLGPEMSKRLIKQHDAVLIPDIKTKPDILKYIPVDEPKSLFIFPLVAGEQLVGLALFISKTEAKLEQKTLKTVTAISNEIAKCIKNANRYLELKHSYMEAVAALIHAIEGKDKYQKGHSEVVAELAGLVAAAMKLPPENVELIRIAGLLHDIGKVAISEQILLKKEKLTVDEHVALKMHTIISSSIVRRVDKDNKLLPIVLYHHERYDGSGYPEGLRGEAIPVGARILTVCDAYKAMISDRPYRKGLAKQEAVAELKRCAGTQFDPEIVKVFIGTLSKTII
jgi:putative nucleotidyltransferase with HDIG domain